MLLFAVVVDVVAWMLGADYMCACPVGEDVGGYLLCCLLSAIDLGSELATLYVPFPCTAQHPASSPRWL
jgi:hypothetical protein